jgi:hypothetical protein
MLWERGKCACAPPPPPPPAAAAAAAAAVGKAPSPPGCCGLSLSVCPRVLHACLHPWPSHPRRPPSGFLQGQLEAFPGALVLSLLKLAACMLDQQVGAPSLAVAASLACSTLRWNALEASRHDGVDIEAGALLTRVLDARRGVDATGSFCGSSSESSRRAGGTDATAVAPSASKSGLAGQPRPPSSAPPAVSSHVQHHHQQQQQHPAMLQVHAVAACRVHLLPHLPLVLLVRVPGTQRALARLLCLGLKHDQPVVLRAVADCVPTLLATPTYLAVLQACTRVVAVQLRDTTGAMVVSAASGAAAGGGPCLGFVTALLRCATRPVAPLFGPPDGAAPAGVSSRCTSVGPEGGPGGTTGAAPAAAPVAGDLRALALSLDLALPCLGAATPGLAGVVDGLLQRVVAVVEELGDEWVPAGGDCAPPACRDALGAVVACLRTVVSHVPWASLGRLSERFKRLLLALRGLGGLDDQPSRVVADLLGLLSGLVTQAAPSSTPAAVCRHVVSALAAGPSRTPADVLFSSEDTALSVSVLVRAALSGLCHEATR